MRSSQKQERDGAARHGARVTPGSGSKDSKNDARNRKVSIEFKQTGAIQFVLKLDELVAASRYAVQQGAQMVFGVEFRNARNPGQPWRYVVEEESDYLERATRVDDLEKEGAYLRDLVAKFENAERERNTQNAET